MFQVEYRCVSINHAESDGIIVSGQYRQWLCQDWRCPKRTHCGKHFGLSKRYAEMSDQRPDEALLMPSRTDNGCRHYKRATRDHFATSLGQQPGFPVLAIVKEAGDGR